MPTVITPPVPGPQGPQGPPGPVADPETIGQAIDEYLDENPIADEVIEQHVNDPDPHPAYDDDLPSLTLIFENHLI